MVKRCVHLFTSMFVACLLMCECRRSIPNADGWTAQSDELSFSGNTSSFYGNWYCSFFPLADTLFSKYVDHLWHIQWSITVLTCLFQHRLLCHNWSSSSSSTNFIATQVLNKTSGPLCVTCYTSVNATVAGGVRCRMIYGTVPSSVRAIQCTV